MADGYDKRLRSYFKRSLQRLEKDISQHSPLTPVHLLKSMK